MTRDESSRRAAATDWNTLRRMSDAQIHRSIASDPTFAQRMKPSGKMQKWYGPLRKAL